MQSEESAKYLSNTKDEVAGEANVSTDCNNSAGAQADIIQNDIGTHFHGSRERSVETARKSRKNSPYKSAKKRPRNVTSSTQNEARTVSCDINGRLDKQKEELATEPKICKMILKSRRKGKKKQKCGSFTRRLWSDDEDDAIMGLVQKYGIRKWTLISRKLQEEYQIYGRSGKQCRER